MKNAMTPRESHLDPTLAEFAHEVVTAAAGEGTVVTALELLSGGAASTSLVVSLARPPRRLVLKLAPRESPTVDFARTAAAMSLARAAGVPLPETLAGGSSSRAGPWQYLLYEHVDGLEWRRLRPQLDARELDSAHRQIATAVLALQSVRLAAFGELDHVGQPIAVDVLACLRHRAELRIAKASDQEHHGNVLFRPAAHGWQLAALIDWDKAWAGPAESDLARMSWWDDMTGPGFWEVYRAAVPVADGHRERTLIFQLLWCLEYGQSTPRHLTDTAGLCRQLGVRRGDDPAR